MAAAEPIGLAGLDTLTLEARVILTDNAGEHEALNALTPHNPRVCFAVATGDADLSPLAGREVVVWVSRPCRDYWLAQSAQAWLKRVAAIASPVSVVVDDESTGPARWSGDALGKWLTARLEPVGAILPSNVTPIKPDTAPAKPRQDYHAATLLREDLLAAAFTAAHPHMRYVSLWGRWLEWDGSRWLHDTTDLALDYAHRACLRASDDALSQGITPVQYNRARTEKTRNAVEKLARTSRAHASDAKDWDADLWALCTPGGIVDLRTGTLRPATPDDLTTKQTNATPQGDCPTWRKFIDQATEGDKELQVYLQRMAGYMLTGDTSEEVFFFAHGGGGNGKGTFINTLLEILGEYAKSSSMDVFTESRESRHTTEVARLRGARFVAAQEVEEGKRWAENRLKEMTGGDTLTARFMRQDDFEFKPQFKLLLAGNNKPALRTIDDAIKRRLHLIPFVVKFSGSQRDNGLKAKLLAERDGILAWAVEGCLEWQRIGLSPPDRVSAATAEYIESQDVMRQWIDDRCDTHPQGWSIVTKLYASYVEWCKTGGETYVMPLRKWSAKLQERGHAFRRGSQGTKVMGLKLADSMTMTRGYEQDDMPGF